MNILTPGMPQYRLLSSHVARASSGTRYGFSSLLSFSAITASMKNCGYETGESTKKLSHSFPMQS